jgi:hypothetical protein
MAVKIAKTAIIRRRIRRDVQASKRQQNPSEHMAILAGLILLGFFVLHFFEPKKFPQASFNAIRKTDGKGDKDRYLVIYPNMKAALLVSTDGDISVVDGHEEIANSLGEVFDPFYNKRDRRHHFEGATQVFYALEAVKPDLKSDRATNFALMRSPYNDGRSIPNAQVITVTDIQGTAAPVVTNIENTETAAIIKGTHPVWKTVRYVGI